MKNTNGPWINTTDGEANFYGIATKNDWLFRIQQNGSLTIDEQEANAKLIGSAPELLQALKEAKKELDYLVENDWGTPSDLMLNIEDAIKKATE